jgi:hypothetical protein
MSNVLSLAETLDLRFKVTIFGDTPQGALTHVGVAAYLR